MNFFFTWFVLLSFIFTLVFCENENSTYGTCGDVNSDDVNSVINATVDRLMELRHPSWGWTNTPEVVLGLQLSAQENFFGREKAVKQMKAEIDSDLDSMNIGKLALYVMAIKSTCENPRKFGKRNLVKILNTRIQKQFCYDGKQQTVPYDRYYRFGLALGALCVNERPTRISVIEKLIEGQNPDGSFGNVHSVDDAAQILLSLRCVATEPRPCFQIRKINTSIHKLILFLRSQTIADGQNVWVGNKYSSPSSALGLMEADCNLPEYWRCSDIMKSLTINPDKTKSEGAFSQRLPALSGISYFNLKNHWECEETVSIPSDYVPTCDPTDQSTCNSPVVTEIPETLIDVRLTIFTDAPPLEGNVPNANVVVSINKGSTLYDALVEAKDDNLLTFDSKSSSWGQSITAMQGVVADADAHEYWALIYGATGELLPLGASSYIPTNNEQIVFRLKNW